MPTIQILYDDSVVPDGEVKKLGGALRKFALKSNNLNNISNSFAYGESHKIKVGLAPLEVYMKITRSKINDERAFLSEMRTLLSKWKQDNNFEYPVNLLLMPMDWLIEDNI